MTKNFCFFCLHEWFPRSEKVSRRCPKCGKVQDRKRNSYGLAEIPVGGSRILKWGAVGSWTTYNAVAQYEKRSGRKFSKTPLAIGYRVDRLE